MKRLSKSLFFSCLTVFALAVVPVFAQTSGTRSGEMMSPPGTSTIERHFQDSPIEDGNLDPDESTQQALRRETMDQAVEQATEAVFAETFDGKSDEPGNDAIDEAVEQSIDLAIAEEIDDAIDQAAVLRLQGQLHHSPSTLHNGATALWNHRVTSTLMGSIGLLRTDSAILGQNGLMRLSLAGLFASQDDFPTRGTDTTHAGARLAMDLVFLKYFEGYLSYGIASNFADEGESSRLLQTLGDFQFGLKGSSQVFKGFYLGGALNFGLAPGFGADWNSGMSFNFAPRLIASWDVRSLNADVPLLLHLNLGAIFTNQDGVYDDYSPDAFDEFAFSLNRYNRLSIALGFEIPLPWVTPFLEWNMALPITSSDLYSHGGKSVSVASVMEHRMSLGLKVTALPDVTFTLALDVGLSSEVARGIASIPSVTFIAGLSYAFDPLFHHRDPDMDELDNSRLLSPPQQEFAAGTQPDSDEASQWPVQAGDDSSEDFSSPSPMPTDLQPAEVAPLPKPRLFLMGEGSPRAGRIDFVDAAQTSIEVAAHGLELELEAGEHKLLVQAPGFLAKIETLNIAEGQERFEIALTPRPAEALLESGGTKVIIPANLLFKEESAKLSVSDDVLLDQIADLLLSGEVMRLRIEGHTDNRGNAAQKLNLSTSRAQALREVLIARGVAAERLVAEGKGGSVPISSNALSLGRVRNRRIELHVLPAK